MMVKMEKKQTLNYTKVEMEEQKIIFPSDVGEITIKREHTTVRYIRCIKIQE